MGVIIGSIVGHAACTGAAVLGGKHLAEHIDETIVGVRLLSQALMIWLRLSDWHHSVHIVHR